MNANINRREFIKGAFGVVISLALPIKSKPYFDIIDEAWGDTWYAGETFTMDLEFTQKSLSDMEFSITNTVIHGNEVTITVEEKQS